MKFIIYRDSKGEWRWNCFASNGKIIADSGEGYKRISSCRKTLDRMIANIINGKFTKGQIISPKSGASK